MFILYDFVFLIVTIIHLPVYLFRRKFHRGFLARMGFLPRNLIFQHPIWVHAVSVGEAAAVRGLIQEIRKIYPQKQIVLSTVTATGNKIARAIAQKNDFVTYLPLDFGFIVRSVINKVNPDLFIIAETEIWPNLITYLSKQKIPVAVVNGRISDNSFRGYRMIRLFISPILRKVSLFCVQGEDDAKRLSVLGIDKKKISVSGNMKFDNALRGRGQDAHYRQILGLSPREKVFVAASTHSGEERAVLDVYRDLLNAYPDLRLLIAPRHPERAAVIEEIVRNSGFSAQMVSRISGGPDNGRPIFILDTIGQLMDYYAIADIVFVGGSFVKVGGHNILEPASLGKPVIFGPYMFNFRDIAAAFLNAGAAVQVSGPEELSAQVKKFLGGPDKVLAIGRRARELIENNRGATLKTAELISDLYAKNSL